MSCPSLISLFLSLHATSDDKQFIQIIFSFMIYYRDIIHFPFATTGFLINLLSLCVRVVNNGLIFSYSRTHFSPLLTKTNGENKVWNDNPKKARKKIIDIPNEIVKKTADKEGKKFLFDTFILYEGNQVSNETMMIRRKKSQFILFNSIISFIFIIYYYYDETYIRKLVCKIFLTHATQSSVLRFSFFTMIQIVIIIIRNEKGDIKHNNASKSVARQFHVHCESFRFCSLFSLYLGFEEKFIDYSFRLTVSFLLPPYFHPKSMNPI